jgi:hypothetical protein
MALLTTLYRKEVNGEQLHVLLRASRWLRFIGIYCATSRRASPQIGQRRSGDRGLRNTARAFRRERHRHSTYIRYHLPLSAEYLRFVSYGLLFPLLPYPAYFIFHSYSEQNMKTACHLFTASVLGCIASCMPTLVPWMPSAC